MGIQNRITGKDLKVMCRSLRGKLKSGQTLENITVHLAQEKGQNVNDPHLTTLTSNQALADFAWKLFGECSERCTVGLCLLCSKM